MAALGDVGGFAVPQLRHCRVLRGGADGAQQLSRPQPIDQVAAVQRLHLPLFRSAARAGLRRRHRCRRSRSGFLHPEIRRDRPIGAGTGADRPAGRHSAARHRLRLRLRAGLRDPGTRLARPRDRPVIAGACRGGTTRRADRASPAGGGRRRASGRCRDDLRGAGASAGARGFPRPRPLGARAGRRDDPVDTRRRQRAAGRAGQHPDPDPVARRAQRAADGGEPDRAAERRRTRPCRGASQRLRADRLRVRGSSGTGAERAGVARRLSRLSASPGIAVGARERPGIGVRRPRHRGGTARPRLAGTGAAICADGAAADSALRYHARPAGAAARAVGDPAAHPVGPRWRRSACRCCCMPRRCAG